MKSVLTPLIGVATLLTLGGCEGREPTAPPGPRFNQQGVGAGGQPEIFRFEDPFETLFPAGTFCDFALLFQGDNKIVVQVFATHIAIHVNHKGTATNLATGFSIEDNASWTDILHLDEMAQLENVTTIGNIVRIVIRGQGIVVQDVGVITVDVNTWEVLFEAGPHDSILEGTDYCALLS